MQQTKENLIRFWERNGIVKSKRVIEAFRKTRREDFIPEEYKKEAYEDIPLPIAKGQTISQPTTIAAMLEFLDVKENSKILEVGAGSGYNAALMSCLTKNKIITMERIAELAELARTNIKRAGIKNVEVVHADGTDGYEKEAPYDRIIATCGSTHIPGAWKDQLKNNGILVVPVGHEEREMIVAKKAKDALKAETKGLYRFVPLIKGTEN